MAKTINSAKKTCRFESYLYHIDWFVIVPVFRFLVNPVRFTKGFFNHKKNMTHYPSESDLTAARIKLHHFINSPAYLGQDEVIVPLIEQPIITVNNISNASTATPVRSITFKRVIDGGLPVWIVKTLIILTFFTTSCATVINLTPAQRAEKNFNRFRPRQNESRLAQVVGFAGIGLGLYYNSNLKSTKP